MQRAVHTGPVRHRVITFLIGKTNRFHTADSLWFQGGPNGQAGVKARQVPVAPQPPRSATLIRALLYNAAGHDQAVDLSAFPAKALSKNQLLWIDGPAAELRALTVLPADMADRVRDDAAGGLEILDPVYRFAIPVPAEVAKGTRCITFIVGKTWLVTMSDPRPQFMDAFVDTDKGESLNGRMSPSALAVALVAELLDIYRTELSHIDERIDRLDDDILRSREKRPPLATLARLRRHLSGLRSTLDDTGKVIHALIRPDFFAHVDAADQGYFEGLDRSHGRLQDAVARARETIIGSFDLYTTRVAQDTNQLVKALTITTVVTGIIGAVAGVFGMNFDTPFTHAGMTGFIAVTAAMVLTSLGIMSVALWRKWL